MATVEMARIPGEKPVVNSLVPSLLATERSSIPEKDQATAELEGRKLEAQSNETTARSLTGLIKNFSASSSDARKP